MAHTNDKRDPSRVVEVDSVVGRNSWARRVFGVLAGHDNDHPDLPNTTDRDLHMGPAPGRVPRLVSSMDGGYLTPGVRAWPAFYDVAHIPHVQLTRTSQRAIPRQIADNSVVIPAVYVGNPV